MAVIIRFIKRLFVFMPALAVYYLAIKNIYPTLHDWLPAAPALVLAYLIAAYILIPTIIRVVRILVPPRHVPLYATTPDGFASDPVQIALFGSREQVIEAMQKIGWKQADERTLKTIIKVVVSIVLRKPYPHAPFSTLYLLGRTQDLGFQLPLENDPRHRHHVRFWAVRPAVAEHFKEHVAFWHSHHKDTDPANDRFLWLGAASLDTGLGLIRHNTQLTHMIHPDTNAERELIVSSLQKAGVCKKVRRVKIASPYQLRNRVVTGYLETDGVLAICAL